jgi:hypothetical protein
LKEYETVYVIMLRDGVFARWQDGDVYETDDLSMAWQFDFRERADDALMALRGACQGLMGAHVLEVYNQEDAEKCHNELAASLW